MAKRFTDTEKWKRPWWRKLDPKAKLTWLFLVDNCDHAGVWIADFELASFQLGFNVTAEEMTGWFEDKIELVDSDKYFLPSFIEFQYGELRDNNSVHVSVINTLRKLGISVQVEEGYSLRPGAILDRLSRKKKMEIMAEDYHRCTYCGTPGDEFTLAIDHIVPRCKGGENNEINLTTACISCNAKKNSLDVSDFIERHHLSDRLSEKIKMKIEAIRALKAPIKGLKGPKDKEEEEDKNTKNCIKGSVRGELPELAVLWNQHCGKLAKVQGSNKTRDGRIKERLKEEPDLAKWVAIITRIEASEFCNGSNDKGWRADFDWLLQPEVRLKVSEGKYDNREKPKQASDVQWLIQADEFRKAASKTSSASNSDEAEEIVNKALGPDMAPVFFKIKAKAIREYYNSTAPQNRMDLAKLIKYHSEQMGLKCSN